MVFKTTIRLVYHTYRTMRPRSRSLAWSSRSSWPTFLDTPLKLLEDVQDIRQYKKYSHLRDFVPLMVCISRGYFEDDEDKLNIIVESLCLSEKATSEFSVRMILLKCPRVVEKVVRTANSLKLANMQEEIATVMSSQSAKGYWKIVSDVVSNSPSKKM